MNASQIIEKLGNRSPSIMGKKLNRQAAVLLPLLTIRDETHILFQVRSMQLKSQPGDICFPGGRMEPEDESPKQTAIRETMEELGVREESIDSLIPLDYIANNNGRIIYPFVGRLHHPDEIAPNKAEVEEVFTVPLDYLLEAEPEVYKVHIHVKPEENFPFDRIVGGKDYQWSAGHIDELFYQYEGKVIWGLTAKILTHFLHLIKT